MGVGLGVGVGFCRAFAASYNENCTKFLTLQFFTKLFMTNLEIALYFTSINKKFTKCGLLTFNRHTMH